MTIHYALVQNDALAAAGRQLPAGGALCHLWERESGDGVPVRALTVVESVPLIEGANGFAPAALS